MDSQNKEITEVTDVTEYKPNNNGGGNNLNNNNASSNQIGKINLPNKLTIFRIILVPVLMVFILIPIPNETWSKIFAAALFLIASLTDFIDGFLARRLKLITDFGKLMDPLADKFLVLGALIAITASPYFETIRFFCVWLTAIVFFRELAVTSMRLIAKSDDGNVIAANWTGKLKTFSQCVCIMTILLEDSVLTQNLNTPPYLFSYITMAVMLILTVFSGFVYFKTYWKYINPQK